VSPVTDATGGPDPEWGNEIDEKPDHDAASCPFGHIGGMCAGDAILGGPHGLFQVLPPGPMPEPRDLTEEEQREAATRYLKARYAQATDLWVSGAILRDDSTDPPRWMLGAAAQEPEGPDPEEGPEDGA
jgi:hypothetical protein